MSLACSNIDRRLRAAERRAPHRTLTIMTRRTTVDAPSWASRFTTARDGGTSLESRVDSPECAT